MLVDLKKNITVRTLPEIICMIALYAMMDNLGGIKKYAIVMAACLLLFVAGRKKRWSLEQFSYIALPTAAYVLMGCVCTLFGTGAQTNTVKVVLYVLLPLFFAFSIYALYGKETLHMVDIQFVGSVAAYAIFDAPYFAKIFHWESIYAFTFGIFVIYYLYQKKWIPCMIALAFVFFAEKRIALAAIFAAVILMAIVWLFQQNKKLILALWGVVSACVFGYLYLIYSGIMEAFCWGANINTNGRVEIYARMAAEAAFSPFYFGRGLGIAEYLLERWNVSMYVNLHNDLLKFYIELGFVGLLIYLASFGVMLYLVGKRFGKAKMSYFFGIVVYTMVLFATDNVSIYLIYLIPMYSTFFAVLASEKCVKKE